MRCDEARCCLFLMRLEIYVYVSGFLFIPGVLFVVSKVL